MRHFTRLLLLMLAAALCPQLAVAGSPVQGTYNDPGGGTFWASVWIDATPNNYSFHDVTGMDEASYLNSSRGFESSDNAVTSPENPTVTFKFKYRPESPNATSLANTSQEFYLKKVDGTLIKIGTLPSGYWFLVQNNTSYGALVCVEHTDDWLTVRFSPNQACREEISEFHVENTASYSLIPTFLNMLIVVRSSYHKALSFQSITPPEAKLSWIAPGKVRITVDNSWLPTTLGNNTENYTFTTQYGYWVQKPDGSYYNNGRVTATNRTEASADITVPLKENFRIMVVRGSYVSYTFGGIDYNETSGAFITNHSFNNANVEVSPSFNQVTDEVRLQWDVPEDVRKEGDFKVYRTTLNENGTFKGNRDYLGSTSNNYFVDDSSLGLEYLSHYRYEVFQQKSSWGEVELPSEPDKYGDVVVGEARVSTAPVVPLHLVQDTTDLENITFRWDFGNIPNSEYDITFKVNRIEPDGTITRSYKEVTVPRDAGTASFTDDKPASICTVYGYYLQLDMIDNKVHLYSDTIQAHVMAGTTVKSLVASKALSNNSVKLAWTANQVGTDIVRHPAPLHRRQRVDQYSPAGGH